MQQKVKAISYKGKSYVEVAERVNQVHARELPFEVISSTPLTLGERVIWQVQVKVDGKIYTGSAEAKLVGAAPKSADATNPFECAETSALGRALAFAGFGSVDSIASYDEIARSKSPEDIVRENEEYARAQENNKEPVNLGGEHIPTGSQLQTWVKSLDWKWDEVIQRAFAKVPNANIPAIIALGSDLSPTHCKRVDAYIKYALSQEKQAS